MNDKKQSKDNADANEGVRGPLFYKKLIPLRKDLHADLTISKNPDYKFAAQANALPVILSEFVSAQRAYPIFFSGEEEPVPLVAVGPYNERRNSYIDSKGKWTDGNYIPLYLRRYPFIFVGTGEEGDKNSQVLAIDEESSLWSNGSGLKIFDGPEGRTPVDAALEMCQQYFVVGAETQKFVQALVEHDLLGWQSLSRRDLSKKESEKDETLFSFRAVNPEKLSKLEDAAVLDLYRKGYLGAIYAHLSSLQNWTRLTDEIS